MKKTSYWNYRILMEKDTDGSSLFTVRDVYYVNDKPKSWGSTPQWPQGENPIDVLCDISMMSAAYSRPILTEIKGELVEVKVNRVTGKIIR